MYEETPTEPRSFNRRHAAAIVAVLAIVLLPCGICGIMVSLAPNRREHTTLTPAEMSEYIEKQVKIQVDAFPKIYSGDWELGFRIRNIGDQPIGNPTVGCAFTTGDGSVVDFGAYKLQVTVEPKSEVTVKRTSYGAVNPSASGVDCRMVKFE